MSNKFNLGQLIKAEGQKGIITKVFETTKDGYLYEVLVNGDYLLYLEKEMELVKGVSPINARKGGKVVTNKFKINEKVTVSTKYNTGIIEKEGRIRAIDAFNDDIVYRVQFPFMALTKVPETDIISLEEPKKYYSGNDLENMSKEQLLEVLKTYSNYVDINSKMNKLSIMSISEYINSNKYKDLCNQKDEISESSNVSIHGDNPFKDEQKILLDTLKNSKFEVIPASKIEHSKYLQNILSAYQDSDSFIPTDKSMMQNTHRLSKYTSLNDVKIGEQVLVLRCNKIGTVIDIEDQIVKVGFTNNNHITESINVNKNDIRKVIKVEK